MVLDNQSFHETATWGCCTNMHSDRKNPAGYRCFLYADSVSQNSSCREYNGIERYFESLLRSTVSRVDKKISHGVFTIRWAKLSFSHGGQRCWPLAMLSLAGGWGFRHAVPHDSVLQDCATKEWRICLPVKIYTKNFREERVKCRRSYSRVLSSWTSKQTSRKQNKQNKQLCLA